MSNAEAFDRTYLWHFRAELLGIHDGDTVTVLADTGYRGRHEVRLRIANIWAPELSMAGGALATRRLTDILALRDHTERWNLRVITQQRERVVTEVTSFERYVGDLYVAETTTTPLIDVAGVMAHFGYGQLAA